MTIEIEPIGIVRTVDDLGRIIIPKDLRIVSGIHIGDSFEVYADKSGNVFLRKIKNGDC